MGRGGCFSGENRLIWKICCPLPCILLLVMCIEGWARPLGLSGSWRYMKSENGTSQETFLQNYNVDFGYDLTEAASLSGSMRYNRYRTDNRITEVYAPVFSMNLRNDIFSANLASSLTERKDSDGPNFSTKTWEFNWNSNWVRPLWPSVRFFFGQSWFSDDQSPKILDTKSYHNGVNLDWEWDSLETFYSYYHSNSKDMVNNSESDDARHFVRGQYSRSFLDNRLGLSLSQQFNYNRNRTEAWAGPGGTALIKTSVLQAYAGPDNTPATDLPPVASGLINQNTADTAYQATSGETTNIAIRVDSVQVDLVYLYTETDLGVANATSFSWAIYSSSDGSTWTQETSSAGFSYDSSFRRFEIHVPSLKVKYVKLVATQPLAFNFYFSEVEAFQEVSGTGTVTLSRYYRTYLTDASVNYHFTDNIDLAYTISLEYSRPSDGADSDRRSQVGSLNWMINPKLSSTFSVSETWQQDENQPETTTRSYSISLNSAPIPTLDISFGITKNDNYEDGDKISSTYNYTIYTTAALFPDLDSSLDLTYTNTENYESNTTTDGYSARLTLTARLTPKLTMDLNSGYSQSSSDGSDTDTVDTNINLTWRPADVFSLRGSAYSRWESDSDDSRGLSLSTGIATTENTQLSLSYSYSYSTSESQTYNGFWSWTISEYLSFQLNGSYQIREDEEPWMVSGQLNARFSGL